jgi:hypothetical protein
MLCLSCRHSITTKKEYKRKYYITKLEINKSNPGTTTIDFAEVNNFAASADSMGFSSPSIAGPLDIKHN